MPYVEFPAVEFKCPGLMIDGDIQFLFEIAAHPHVMIAGEKMDRDTTVGDLRQLSQNAGISFGDHGSVLVPEIEQVPDDENDRRILPDLFQKDSDSFLAEKAGGMIGCAQMKVREKIDLLSGRDLHARIYDVVPQRLSTRKR